MGGWNLDLITSPDSLTKASTTLPSAVQRTAARTCSLNLLVCCQVMVLLYVASYQRPAAGLLSNKLHCMTYQQLWLSMLNLIFSQSETGRNVNRLAGFLL